jgi:hypothetical protein
MATRAHSDLKSGLHLPTLAEAEAAIGEPAAQWVSRCYEISYKLVERGLVNGRAVYGHFLGPVAPDTHFYKRSQALPFIAHGWVELEDGRILDPTRWVFEGAQPYLYVGEDNSVADTDLEVCLCGHIRAEHDYGGFFNPCTAGCGEDCEDFERDPGVTENQPFEYDEGGNVWRESNLAPPPLFDPAASVAELDFSPKVAMEVALLLGGSPQVTVPQALWLANLPLTTLGTLAQPVFEALVAGGLAGFLPYDNRVKVLGRAG